MHKRTKIIPRPSHTLELAVVIKEPHVSEE